MSKIVVIGTRHNAIGRCNVDVLHGLLEELAPDVIFEELRPTDFEARYGDEALHSLEMRAVSRYAQGRPSDLIAAKSANISYKY